MTFSVVAIALIGNTRLGEHMVFVSAKVGPPNIGDDRSKFTVQYFDEQGNMNIRSGGTRTWRCNNLGALLKSSYSTSKGPVRVRFEEK